LEPYKQNIVFRANNLVDYKFVFTKKYFVAFEEVLNKGAYRL